MKMLSIQHLSGGYSGKDILKDISFEVSKGEFFGILGPNGSGKTTLLNMICGMLPFQEGEILLKNRPLLRFSTRELAKTIAVLPQHSMQTFSYTVKETVSLGRYAYQRGLFRSWSDADENIVQRVMSQTGVATLQDKSVQELSGGERQRVYLAQALAQEPEILLLDEPTNHLDLTYQKELLDHLKKLTMEKELTVISIFHDLNLAGLYCDRLLLLEKGTININHRTSEVLKEERIRAVYKADIKNQPHPIVPVPQMVLLPTWNNTELTNCQVINPGLLTFTENHIVLQSPVPLRTMSSGVVGSGVGWNQTFVNRHVDKDYNCENHREEMASYLKENGFTILGTVGMMTAVMLEDVSFKMVEEEDFSILVVVTAGTGNAVDASLSDRHQFALVPGTINTWIFVNGELSEEAFIQSIMTATEAKGKAMENQKITDSVTGTIATGTSTDSILIGATQKGKKLEYAGTITPLGKLISKGVYECTTEAIQNSRKRYQQ